MSSNGRLIASELSNIPGGRLRHDAAVAWNDMRDYIGRRHGVWITPTGPNSSYRTYEAQLYFWDLYRSGRGNVAAFPGTSNHGWGLAVDVATQQMAYYIRAYGRKFGWSWDEGQRVGEWWHFRYIGGYKGSYVHKPSLPNYLTKKEKIMAGKLRLHRWYRAQEEKSGKGPKWKKHDKWVNYWYHEIEKHIGRLKGQTRKRPKRRQVLRNVLKHKFDWQRRSR